MKETSNASATSPTTLQRTQRNAEEHIIPDTLKRQPYQPEQVFCELRSRMEPFFPCVPFVAFFQGFPDTSASNPLYILNSEPVVTKCQPLALALALHPEPQALSPKPRTVSCEASACRGSPNPSTNGAPVVGALLLKGSQSLQASEMHGRSQQTQSHSIYKKRPPTNRAFH